MGCSNEELNEKRRLGHSEVKFIEDSFFRIFYFTSIIIITIIIIVSKLLLIVVY